jgi:endonuclease/exonuclease/phosphatase family metal-dependent hydrolase
MKRISSLIVTSAFLVSSAIAAPVDVDVLTWNIHRAIGSNSPASSQQPYVAKIINFLQPDIWNINELGGNGPGYNTVAEKAALTNFINSNITIFGNNPQEGRDYFVYVGNFSDGFIGNAIVSRYALTDQASFFDGLRGIIHANAVLPNGATLGVFTQHFKATTNSNQSTSDSQRRQTEAELAVENITNWSVANPDTPAVITGDFNLSEDPGQDDNWDSGNIGDALPNGHLYRPISTLKDSGFLDPIPVSRNGDKDTISSGGSNPRNRFDYNLYSNFGDISYKGGSVFNTAAYPIGQTPSGLTFDDSFLASDHLPVLATYSVDSVPEPLSGFALTAGLLGMFRKLKKKERSN